LQLAVGRRNLEHVRERVPYLVLREWGVLKLPFQF
jgi:hypothetical protein